MNLSRDIGKESQKDHTLNLRKNLYENIVDESQHEQAIKMSCPLCLRPSDRAFVAASLLSPTNKTDASNLADLYIETT
jgi:hypothetical protein